MSFVSLTPFFSPAGEFGEVDKYEYLDEDNKKVPLAIKFLRPEVVTNSKEVNSFLNEIRTLKKVILCSAQAASRFGDCNPVQF